MTKLELMKAVQTEICSHCDNQSSCYLCHLNHFDMMLELVAHGITVTDAYKIVEDTMNHSVREKQEKYDRDYGFVH